MSAADKLRDLAEKVLLGSEEKKQQELQAEIRKAQEDNKKS